MVTSYSVYLLFSALGSDPSKECNRLYGAGGSLSNAHATIWQTVVNCIISGASVRVCSLQHLHERLADRRR